jgi:hypothetical protein
LWKAKSGEFNNGLDPTAFYPTDATPGDQHESAQPATPHEEMHQAIDALARAQHYDFVE